MTELDYEPAPPEENLKAARQMLARLCPILLPVAGEGTCRDCGRTRVLLELGSVEVCGAYAEHRLRAAAKAAA
jgi:hypothetical protein